MPCGTGRLPIKRKALMEVGGVQEGGVRLRQGRKEGNVAVFVGDGGWG